MKLQKGDCSPLVMNAFPSQAMQNGDASSSNVSSLSRQSSVKKQLPQVPDLDTQIALNNTMIDKKPIKKAHHSAVFFLEYSILAEYNQLEKHKLPGVYVIPSAHCSKIWHGVLFIRQGIYQEGVFRFTLTIPDNYPDSDCPKIRFELPMFHPIIHPETGELDVKRAFPKWRRNINFIWQVLLYVRRVFYKIDTQSPLNPEAAVLYEHSIEQYRSRAAEIVEVCKEKLYEPPSSDDPHAIRFSHWDPSVHEEAHKLATQPKEKTTSDKDSHRQGLSWMKKGSMNIFSREDTASA